MKPTLLASVVGGKPVQLLALAEIGADVPPFAIVGELDSGADQPMWPSFRRNTGFVDLYSKYMRGELQAKPSVLAKARVRPGDYVYVIDKRTPTPQGNVPFTDIVGWYTSGKDGAPQPQSFTYNKDHILVTEMGDMSGILFEESLHDAIAGETRRLGAH